MQRKSLLHWKMSNSPAEECANQRFADMKGIIGQTKLMFFLSSFLTLSLAPDLPLCYIKESLEISLNFLFCSQTFAVYLKLDAFAGRSRICRGTVTLLHGKLWKCSQGHGPHLGQLQFPDETIQHHWTWFWWCYTVSTIRASKFKLNSDVSHGIKLFFWL